MKSIMPISIIMPSLVFATDYLSTPEILYYFILFLLILLTLSGLWIWNLKKKNIQVVNNCSQQAQLLSRENKLSEIGAMMGNIAHQWKQPLNNIALLVLNIENAHRKNQLTDEYLENKVFAIEDTLEYMSQTIEDFSDYLSPRKEKQFFCINDSVEKAMELTMPTLNSSHIDIIFLADDEYEVSGRKNELTQVLIILINNAKDALLKDKENSNKMIQFELTKDENIIKLIIKDNGLGIPNSLIEKIFNPYFTTNENTKGRGLGLYMAKMIIEGLDGTIKVHNNEGAVFELEFV
jgi:signal transduction histidine kinase